MHKKNLLVKWQHPSLNGSLPEFSCSLAAMPAERPTPLSHPFYVSVTEISHNAKDKTLEISCKLFSSDFETVLEKWVHMKKCRSFGLEGQKSRE